MIKYQMKNLGTINALNKKLNIILNNKILDEELMNN